MRRATRSANAVARAIRIGLLRVYWERSIGARAKSRTHGDSRAEQSMACYLLASEL